MNGIYVVYIVQIMVTVPHKYIQNFEGLMGKLLAKVKTSKERDKNVVNGTCVFRCVDESWLDACPGCLDFGRNVGSLTFKCT